MKQILTLLIISLATFPVRSVYSQVFKPGLSAGMHTGATKAFTDVTDADIKMNIGADLQYNLNNWTFANLQYSMGNLSQKEPDINDFAFTNKYHHLTATANVSLGQILKPDFRVAHYLLYNLYAGSGIGLIMSNISEPNALSKNEYGGITYKGTDVTLPVNLGFNFKVSSYLFPDSPLSFNVNLQHNITFTEMLDGYDASVPGNKYKDAFSTINIGIRYNFGKSKRNY